MRHGIIAATLFISALGAQAGTIISANLPSGSIIVNVDATVDGAATNSGFGADPYAYWYHPFNNASGPLLSTTVQAGTYTFRIVDPADASVLFSSLTSSDLSKIYTAWTYNSPYITDIVVFDGSAATNTSVSQLFDVAPNTQGYSDAASAYAAEVTSGYYNQIQVGNRDSGNFQTSYTFATATTLIFAVPDNGLGDNLGGTSILIQSTGAGDAPEPGTFGLIAGAAAIALAARRFCR